MSLLDVPCPNCGYATTLQSCLYIVPSPFQHLFHSQTSRKEISAVRAELKIFTNAVRGELQDLKARIARLRQSLQEAKQHHAEAEDVLDKHVMLSSPVESLPVEILSYILSLTSKKPINVFGPMPQMPWLLGQVCRNWRALVWQTPTLWNSFAGQDRPRRNSHGLRLAEVLKRSGKIALQVSLAYLAPDCACILACHASRLSELRLKSGLETLNALRASPEMSILTKLCLTVQPPHPPPERVYFDIATKAPCLTHVDLNLDFLSVDIPHVFLLPWQQLTHLHLKLGCSNYRHIIHILSQCRNLVSFTSSYSVSDLSVLQTTPSTIYVFPHLTFLDICSPLAVLPCMQCPALQTFILRGALYGDVELTETDWWDFRAFVDRSHCTLQEVTFIPEFFMSSPREPPTPVHELISFLSHFAKAEIRPPRRLIRRLR